MTPHGHEAEHPRASGTAATDLIDGHTPDDLAAYLRAGRTPRVAAIENSAACRQYLAALSRLQSREWMGLLAEAERDGARDDGWISSLLETIKNEVQAGRDIPIRDDDVRLRLSVSEAAVLGLVRRTADAVDGVILGHCSLVGDVTVLGSPIVVSVTATVRYGRRLDETAALLRARLVDALTLHTELRIQAVDVTIDDVFTTPRDDR